MIDCDDVIELNRHKNSLYVCVRSVRYMTEQLATIASSLIDVAGDYENIEFSINGSNASETNSNYDNIDMQERSVDSRCSSRDRRSTDTSTPYNRCDCSDHSKENDFKSQKRSRFCRDDYNNNGDLPKFKLEGDLIQDNLIDENINMANKELFSENLIKCANSSMIQMNIASQTNIMKSENKESFTTKETMIQTVQSTNNNPFVKDGDSEIEIRKSIVEGNSFAMNNLRSSVDGQVSNNGYLRSQLQSWNSLIKKKLVDKKMQISLDTCDLSVPEIRTTNSEYKNSVSLSKTITTNVISNEKALKNENLVLNDNFLTKDRIVNCQSNFVDKNKSASDKYDYELGKFGQMHEPDVSNRIVSKSSIDDNFLKISPSVLPVAMFLESFAEKSLTQPLFQLCSTFQKDSNTDSNKFSNYDEFDCASEIELFSVCSSPSKTLMVSDLHSDVSVYGSEVKLIDEYYLPDEKSLNSTISDKTVLQSNMSATDSDFSAFVQSISQENQSSKFVRIISNNTSQNLSQSDSTKCCNIKSINTLSTSLRKKCIRYKSISVNNFQIPISNKSSDNIYSQSNLSSYEDLRSVSDISSTCMDSKLINDYVESCYPKNKVFERSLTECNVKHKCHINLELSNKKNQHSEIDSLEGYIFIENFDCEGTISNKRRNNFNTVDVLVASKKSYENLECLSPCKFESSYYDVVQNDEKMLFSNDNITIDENACCLDDLSSPECVADTVYIEAILEINSESSRTSTLKAGRHKHLCSATDDSLIFKLSNSDKMDSDALVSCFESIQIKPLKIIANNTQKLNGRCHKNKRAASRFSKKKNYIKGSSHLSIIECYVDNWLDQRSNDNLNESSRLLDFDKLEYYEP